MKNETKSQAVSLQMVELNNQKFAVEVVNGNVNANLTQMAKPFGKSKSPSNWLRTDESKNYLNELASAQKCGLTDLVQVRNGGKNPGTWCYDFRAVMRFAQWLDNKLAIQVDEMMVKLIAGEAVYTEPFNGVWPVIYNGKPYYFYLDVLESLGHSRTSGSVSERKNNFPQHFVKIFGRNFITLEFCHYLKKRKDAIQLILDFEKANKIALKGGDA
jgi:hypothetical protein